MTESFFISDTHFGHRSIITFDAIKPFRPFSTIEEHDAELVRRWNGVVGRKDIVWHLGDFCFGKKNLEIAALLNGDKRLVMGNHDMYASADYLRYFTRLAGIVEYKGMILSHAPLHPSQLARWSVNVHGHLHVKRLDDPHFINVSCEQINLTPVPLEWVLVKAKESLSGLRRSRES